MSTVENRSDRLALAEDAGLGRLSVLSVLAGVLVSYGAFVVLAGVATAAAGAVHFDTNLTNQEWRQLGITGGLLVGLVLFLSYLFGGYTTGRMARRAGMRNGLLVFVFGIVIAAVTGGVIHLFGADDQIMASLRSVGLPTSAGEWRQVGTVAGLASLVGMLLGALAGGALGERWHTKLVRRALDPQVGPEGAAMARVSRWERRRAAARAAERITTGSTVAVTVKDHPEGETAGESAVVVDPPVVVEVDIAAGRTPDQAEAAAPEDTVK
jgi:hypothetical protein